MTERERKLLARLLRMASDEFAGHTSNDLKLVNTLENRRIAREAGDDYEVLTIEPLIYTQDWLLMSHFAKKLEEIQ